MNQGKKMRKIVFFIGGMNRGGAERVISILANHYAHKGWSVDILMLLDSKVEYILDKRVRCIDLTNKNKSRVLSIPKWLKGIRKYVKDNNPDVILSFVARINALVIFATFGIKTKTVVSERNDPMMDGRSYLLSILINILYRNVDKIVFQTRRAYNFFPEKIQRKSSIIANPITISNIKSNVSDKKIVSVGRLSEQKNQSMLIRAFENVHRKHPDYQLWIYGEGNLRNQLQNLIIEKKLENNVFLPGNVLNIHEQISTAEIFVLSSNYEGLSNALLEAMMMGIPCISTDCAGSDEFIIDNKNGLLIPVRDNKRLETSILKLIEDKELASKLGFQAKQTLEKCKLENIVNEWEKVLE